MENNLFYAPEGLNLQHRDVVVYGPKEGMYQTVLYEFNDEMHETASDDLVWAASTPKEWSRDDWPLCKYWETNAEIEDGDSTNTNKIAADKKRTKAAKGVKKIKSDEEKQKASDAVRKSTSKKKKKTNEEIAYLIKLRKTVSELEEEVICQEKEIYQMEKNLYY
uniref:BZIP domain-containing protein n=1 Tax=Rhabditophanes sp. KR3021 TaxID=114890 RepID=A0AC35U8D2_9BILA